MRLVLVALALLAPTTAAQGVLDYFAVRFHGFEDPIEPRAPAVAAPIVVEGSCRHVGAGADVVLSLRQAPAWFVGTLEPSTIRVEPADCALGIFSVESALRGTVTADAPAERGGELEVLARVGDATATALGLVRAKYFALLDLRVEDPVRTVRPGTTAFVPVTVTNFGNGRTIVDFELVGIPTVPVSIHVPGALSLEARQGGGNVTQRVVEIAVSAPNEAGFTMQEGRATLAAFARSWDADDRGSDAFTVDLRITVRGFALPDWVGPIAPVVAALLVGAGGASAWTVWRKRRRGF